MKRKKVVRFEKCSIEEANAFINGEPYKAIVVESSDEEE